MTMSLASSHSELRARCRDLSQAVTELVTIVHEDRPTGSETAVVDHVAEVVSELQATARLAAELVDGLVDPTALPGSMSRIDRAVADAQATYWRDLVSYRPLGQLRRAAREHGHEWRTWQHTVELSLGRCELALGAAADAVRAAWQEIGELLTHYTRGGVPVTWPPTNETEVSTSTRRQS